MFRLGLVGVGSWGQRYAATVARRDDARIVFFARSSSANDKTIEGAERVLNWRVLLDCARAGELDAVVVATTPENQAEIAEAALNAGVPAIVEKPLGLSRAAAERILAAVRASTVASPFVVNYVQLYTPAHRMLRSLVREAGGSVVSIASEGSNRGPYRSFSSLYDYGPHDLSLCLDLLGADSTFRLGNVSKRSDDEGGELFDALFSLEGVRVSMRVGNGAAAKARRFSVTLDGGRTLTNDNLAPRESMLTDDGKPIPVDPTLPLDTMLDEFLERLERWQRGDRDPARELRDAEFSVRVNEILDAIAAASKG